MRNFLAVLWKMCVYIFQFFREKKYGGGTKGTNTYDDFDSLRTRLGSCFFISDSLTASVNDLKTVLCVLFVLSVHKLEINQKK